MDDFRAANRLNWDNRARLHATDSTGSYRIDEVLSGGDSLHAIEAGEIGDVRGKRLIHLQCHIGLDTISLAGREAIATGLDFSARCDRSGRRLRRPRRPKSALRPVGCLRRARGSGRNVSSRVRVLGHGDLAAGHLSLG